MKMDLLRLVCSFSVVYCVASNTYTIDTSQGLGRQFDGIGGLSGGGATSKLLINYPEPQRSEILDYLFKPNFAASLQILKVEIGGDGESTDGTESSHMHEPWDESYDRGYEWWLMVQAKKRNPAIKLYGLPWSLPGWLGASDPYGNPKNTANYILKWVQGAKKYYNLDIDYLGVWNERKYNTTYIKVLRDVLNKSDFQRIQLVVADGSWDVSKDILKDTALSKAVDYIGAHYPGTYTTTYAMKTGKQLWSSEDYSTFNDGVGAGCWARILNQNYVNGYMTSTISWNLIASYYQALPFGRDGLMTAQEPWSGHYVVQSPIWVTAHTTLFTKTGWQYLRHGSGVGKLQKGGSYVSILDPKKREFTLIIETMSHNHSLCIRPSLPAYNTSPQTATFTLRASLTPIKKLFVWYSKLNFDGKPDAMFQSKGAIQVLDGRFSLDLGVDEVYTLTTVHRDPPRRYPSPPASQTFPLPYTDNYESYPLNSEAYNFVPQVGVWEVRWSGDKGHGKVNQQVILNAPCYWCKTVATPINIGGNYNWTDIFVQTDVRIPSVNGSKGAFIAARVSKGGCNLVGSIGLFFAIYPGSNHFTVTHDLALKEIVITGALKTVISHDKWYHLSLIMRGNKAYGFLGVDEVFNIDVPETPINGFVGYGTASYGLTDFDNLKIQKGGI